MPQVLNCIEREVERYVSGIEVQLKSEGIGGEDCAGKEGLRRKKPLQANRRLLMTRPIGGGRRGRGGEGGKGGWQHKEFNRRKEKEKERKRRH